MSSYVLPVFDISDIPQVALDSMNSTHREEAEIINHLGQLLVQGIEASADSRLITEKLHQWVEHTREHFNIENQMMLDYSFPVYDIHSGEHARVLQQIETLQQQWLGNYAIQPVADFIFNQWPQWFDNHVSSMDRVTAQFLSRAMS